RAPDSPPPPTRRSSDLPDTTPPGCAPSWTCARPTPRSWHGPGGAERSGARCGLRRTAASRLLGQGPMDHGGGLLDLPGPGPQLGQLLGEHGLRRRLLMLPHPSAQQRGLQQVLRRHLEILGPPGRRGAHPLIALEDLGVLLRPQLVRRRIGTLGALGQVRSRQLQPGPGRLPPEVLPAQLGRQRPVERLPAPRSLLRRRHQITILDHTVRVEVLGPGDLVATPLYLTRRGELTDRAQRAETVQPPPARGTGGSVLPGAFVLELLTGPVDLAGRPQPVL